MKIRWRKSFYLCSLVVLLLILWKNRLTKSHRVANRPVAHDFQSGDALWSLTSLHSHNQEIKFPDTLQEKIETNDEQISIALCLAITTRKCKTTEVCSIAQDVNDTPFFLNLMPFFCATASEAYKYNFYLAFDFDDPLLSGRDQLDLFVEYFKLIRAKKCKCLSHVGLNFVNCSHSGRPAWAQNDAVMSAYMDNNDYIYRLNDDVIMTSRKWTEFFVERLLSYDPPNIGVVGPRHTGGNLHILTFEFVHRSHIDIFGFHYPRDFMDWYADQWITVIYQPSRMTKLSTVLMKHNMKLAETRYTHHVVQESEFNITIKRDKEELTRFLDATATVLDPDPSKVIAMFLVGDDPRQTYGAVRNVMLRKLYFPEWSLRIYVEQPSNNSMMSKTTTPVSYHHPPVPTNVIAKLRSLPVELVFVDTKTIKLDPSLWPLLAVDDATVNYLLVRKPSSRLSERDAAVVSDWLDSGKAVHVIKDHAKHLCTTVVDGLWGADTRKLAKMLNGKVGKLLNKSTSEAHFLNHILWPQVGNHAIIHNGILFSANSKPFPLERAGNEYLGQAFGACGERVMEEFGESTECKL